MKIVDPLDKLRWWKIAYTVVALCAATATGLPAQTLTALYSFCGPAPCPQGRYASGALVQGTDGYGYGTTGLGGANPAPVGYGGGTVFKITPSGKLTTLYSFCSQSGCTDGEYPLGGLVQASAGDHDFYGTTAGGGANPCSPPLAFSGCGTIFKISPSGTLTKSVRHKSEESGLIRPPETAPSNPRTSR